MKKKILIILSIVFGVIVLLLATGIIYLQVNYTRIGNVELQINNNQSSFINLNEEYSISTYNLGFGAYDRDFSFFMDEGETLDGVKLQGKYGKAVSYNNVLKNTNGSIDILKQLETDFMLLQEVDTNSTRSYKINQVDIINKTFNNYSNVFSSNFHSGYLPYPIHDMHGIVNSGILSLSKYNINYSNRVELPITTNFFAKFFDLDRCLSVIRTNINNSDKELVIINCHLSAYDEGGIYRKQQIKLLNDLLKSEYEKGNYVIAGGDFNHNIANASFQTIKKTPVWIQPLTNNELTNNFRIEASNLTPTCRDSDSAYVLNESYVSVVDGFIVSDNIEVNYVYNITTLNDLDVSFLYSDHNAVKMEFILK